MGNKNSVTSVSLNYSAIIYSPFEFYSMDDWKSMQRLGVIFEDNLRKHKHDAIEFLEKRGEKNAKHQSYIRKEYEWIISSLDKHLKRGRYSPLYLDWNNRQLQKREDYLPGYKDKFLNYQQFEQLWLQKWKKLREVKQVQDKIRQEKIQQTNQILSACTLFDYLAYRSIIQFLFSETPNYEKPAADKQQNGIISIKNKEYKFSKLLQKINSVDETDIFEKQIKNKVGMQNCYREFLKNTFKRIDDHRKQQITKEKLLGNPIIDIINLQEGNSKISKILSQSPDFYIYGHLQDTTEDQCLTLVRKSMPLVPQGYNQIYQSQKKDLLELRNHLRDFKPLNQEETTMDYWKRLSILIEAKFCKKTIQKLMQVVKNKCSIVDLGKQILGYISNPCKIILDYWLKDYKQLFVKLARQNAQMTKQVKLFFTQIQQRGMLCWSQGFTLIKFTKKNDDDLGEYILGNFHLTSKTPKNKIQVQILGFLIYELLKKKKKFIFSGDFNSHIVLKTKDEKTSMFDTLKKYLKEKKQSGEQEILDKLHIYPKHTNISTTKKKRTIMQVQVNKSNDLAVKCIDQVITNLQIDENHCYVGQINGIGSKTNNNKNFLPNANHPYDHFLVQANIKINP